MLSRLLDGERIGTIFAPAAKKMSARHRWIQSAVRPAGKVVLDHGAAEAVLRSGKSLLARGIVGVMIAAAGDTGDTLQLIPRCRVNRVADDVDRHLGVTLL